jgi:predicted transcriptional regulator of viral defense system
MDYLQFRQKMFDLVCFNNNQIYAWHPNFDRNNLTRWIKKRLLIRLRQGYYTFPEYKNNADITYYFANRIYQPSYISLHSALSYYGIIPESIVQITSVTSLKTATFINEFGEYTYKTVKEELIFGYDLKPMPDGRALKYAKPEKAILDLLYLYPFYNTAQEMQELRFDEDFLHDELEINILKEYTANFKSKALEKRVKLLIKVYEL